MKNKTRKIRNNIFDIGGNINFQRQVPGITAPINGVINNNMNANLNSSNSGTMGIVSAVGTGINLVSDFISNVNPQIPDIKVNPQTTNAKSYDSLMNQWSNWNPIKHITTDDLGGNQNGLISTLGGVAKGASAGASFGPWGAAIGGGIGGLMSGLGSLFGNNSRNKAVKKINKKIDNANNTSLRGFENTGDAITTKNNWNLMNNFYSNGGFVNKFAYGGNFSNGLTIFNNGGTHEQNPYGGIPVSFDKEGNPNLVEENEVKWGDYIFSDRLKINNKSVKEYNLPQLISNKSFAEATKLLQKESSERENDPISKNTLNDFLSKLQIAQENIKQNSNNTTNMFYDGGNLNKRKEFINILNQSKSSNNPNFFFEGKKYNTNEYDNSGYKINKGTSWDPNNLPVINKNNKLNKDQLYSYLKNTNLPESEYEQAYNIMLRESGGIPNNYRLEKDNPGGGNDLGLFQINTKYHPDMVGKYDLFDPQGAANAMADIYGRYGWKPWKSSEKTSGAKGTINDPSKNIIDKKEDNMIGYKNDNDRTRGLLNNIKSNYLNPGINNPKQLIEEGNKGIQGINKQQAFNIQKNNPNSPLFGMNTNELMRYAPVAANAGMFLSDLFNKSEKVNLNTTSVTGIGADKLGNYLKYNPIDSEYIANKVREQSASTKSAIINQSGGNRATATAGLLAADYNLNNALGDAYFKSNQLNEDKRFKVEEFNRGTNMFNIGNDLQAQQFNASARNRANEINTEIENQEINMNMQNRAAARNARRQSLSQFATNLGQIGTENRWMDIAPIINRGYDQYGLFSNKKAMGGVIYKNKIKK